MAVADVETPPGAGTVAPRLFSGRTILASGLLAGVIGAYVVLAGLYAAFAERWLIVELLTVSQALLAGTAAVAGWRFAGRDAAAAAPSFAVAGAALAGAVAGLVLGAVVLFAASYNLRWIFVSLSPPLLAGLRFGLSPAASLAVLAGAGAALSAAGALCRRLPRGWRRPLLVGLGAVVAAGLFSSLVQTLLSTNAVTARLGDLLYVYDGLLSSGAALVFAVAVVGAALRGWPAARSGIGRIMPPERWRRRIVVVFGIAVIVAMPVATNQFIAQVMTIVGLYVLMGFGLNIELGLAGLLDLGFVAFFAVGAYTVALLTANGALAVAHLTFWEALPVAMALAAAAGFVFGLPVLRVRGDYLAVATLGLGEIVRVLVLSDMLKPALGGSQGIIDIPRPSIGAFTLASPVEIAYLALAACAAAAWCAWRMQHSWLGRRWLAVREDEDVAQALGIDLVKVKLLAYTIGAAFAGLAGAVFAAMAGAVFPHSFQLLVSINVLALLVVGGIGSFAGVVIGSLALIGTPELLREFGEFRYLAYGIVMVAMMRARPGGLWPAAPHRPRREGRDG